MSLQTLKSSQPSSPLDLLSNETEKSRKAKNPKDRSQELGGAEFAAMLLLQGQDKTFLQNLSEDDSPDSLESLQKAPQDDSLSKAEIESRQDGIKSHLLAFEAEGPEEKSDSVSSRLASNDETTREMDPLSVDPSSRKELERLLGNSVSSNAENKESESSELIGSSQSPRSAPQSLSSQSLDQILDSSLDSASDELLGIQPSSFDSLSALKDHRDKFQNNVPESFHNKLPLFSSQTPLSGGEFQVSPTSLNEEGEELVDSLDPSSLGSSDQAWRMESLEGRSSLLGKERVPSKSIRASYLPPKEILFEEFESAPSEAQAKLGVQTATQPKNLQSSQTHGNTSESVSDESDPLSLDSPKFSQLIKENPPSLASKKKATLQEGVIPFVSQGPGETHEMKFGVTQGGATKERLTTETVHELTHHISSLSQKGGGEMRIRITPDHLGELSIRVATTGSHVSLQIRASDPKTKKIIEESLDSLKETLSQKSLIVAQLDVSSQNLDGNLQGTFSQLNSSFSEDRSSPGNDSRSFRDQEGSRQPEWKRAARLSPSLTSPQRSVSSRIDVRA